MFHSFVGAPGEEVEEEEEDDNEVRNAQKFMGMFFSHALSPSKKREVHSRRAYDSLLCSGEWMSRETKKLNRREDGNG